MAGRVQTDGAAYFAVERTVLQQFDERCFDTIGDFIGGMLFFNEIRFDLDIA